MHCRCMLQGSDFVQKERKGCSAKIRRKVAASDVVGVFYVSRGIRQWGGAVPRAQGLERHEEVKTPASGPCTRPHARTSAHAVSYYPTTRQARCGAGRGSPSFDVAARGGRGGEGCNPRGKGNECAAMATGRWIKDGPRGFCVQTVYKTMVGTLIGALVGWQVK